MKSMQAVFGIVMASAFLAGAARAEGPTEMPMGALNAFCTAGVGANPVKPGFWHYDTPRFANAAEGLFATTRLRDSGKGAFAVVKLVDGSSPATVVQFDQPVRDIAVQDGKLWALLRSQVLALDLASGHVVQTLNLPSQPVSEEDAAQSFVWVGGRLVIAQGSKGAAIYDARTQSFSQVDLGLLDQGRLSKAIDVAAVNDGQVAFAVEAISLTKQAPFTFNGVVVLDLAAGKVEKFAYNRASSGIVSNARIAVDGDQVILNNWGILQRGSLAAMRQSGEMEVVHTPVQFSDHGAVESGELLGDLLITKDQILACAQTQYRDASSGKMVHVGALFSHQE